MYCSAATVGASSGRTAASAYARVAGSGRQGFAGVRPLICCRTRATQTSRRAAVQQRCRQLRFACHASASPPPGGNGGGNVVGDLLGRINAAYLVIFGVFGGLLLLRNPYIFAGLTILTIIPQNSSNASLNSLVLLFYESGLFMNFAEAVYCVRLVTWLSIACTLISFAIYT